MKASELNVWSRVHKIYIIGFQNSVPKVAALYETQQIRTRPMKMNNYKKKIIQIKK